MQEYNMGRVYFFILIFNLIFFGGQVFGQSDEQSYSEEFAYGINFNTNAGLIGGFNLRWSKAKGEKQFQCFGFEFVHIKNSKEIRNRDQNTGNSFLAYKTNYLFSLRPFYGREFCLFKKASEEGIHINMLFGGGPSIGLLKPYYVLLEEPPFSNPPSPVSVPYTEGLEKKGLISGSGYFTDGFDQIKATLGGHVKASLTFEFGQIKSSVVGLETGVVAEKFSREQKIMAYVPTQSFFTSAFITLYYGRKY
jgi:hypothetical protein